MAIMKMPAVGVEGGGEPVLLWSNQSPTSAMGSSSAPNTAISLSQSYDNFDMLRLEYVTSTTDQAVTYTMDIDPSIIDSGNVYRYVMGTNGGGRYVYYENAQHTQVRISPWYQLYSAVSNYTNCIPIKIYGVKSD